MPPLSYKMLHFTHTVFQKGGEDMSCFEVLESGEGIQEEIARRLQRAGVLACGWSSPSRPALLIISPRTAAQTRRLEMGCRTVLLPGDAPALHWQLQAASAVSYGPGPRNTLTLSSREGSRLWLALQREVVTVQGQVVERQEFPFASPPGQSTQAALAVAGGLLLLGVRPEHLS